MVRSLSVPAIGIDLGTTNSCVAVYKDGEVHILRNEHSEKTTPSYVAFKNGERIIGKEALDRTVYDFKNTVYDVKRLIDRRYGVKTVLKDLNHWMFSVTNENNKPMINIPAESRKFHPEQISAMVLNKMKNIAQDFLSNKKVKDAVITVPAYFNDSQRHATLQAGKIAGLDVLKLLVEPTAAALAYGLHRRSKKPRNILIYDLGGGTFDVSLITIHDNIIEVKAINGDAHLDGKDFDNRLVEYIITQFKKISASDIDPKEIRRLKRKCEKAKKELTTRRETTIVLDEFSNSCDGFSNIFRCKVTRSLFEEINDDLFRLTILITDETLRHVNMRKYKIDEVVVVGGSTRIPKIQFFLKEYFDGKNLNNSLNPDEAIAYGAAMQAAMLQGNFILRKMQLVDVTPFSLGINVLGGNFSVIIKRNSKIPVENSKTFVTSFDNQRQVESFREKMKPDWLIQLLKENLKPISITLNAV